MTIKECRRYLRKWRQTETSLNRLKTEKRVIEETIQALYELTLIPSDGQPHGNAVTHPTEDKALRIIELMKENEHRTEDIDRRIEKAERYLKRVELVMTVAKHADLLKRYYHDGLIMQKVADEMHISIGTAKRNEADGIRSICDLL
jgi:AraC-like DNA-binding protein